MAAGELAVKRREPTEEEKLKIWDAARNGNVGIIQTLISSGIDVARITDLWEDTPLHNAASGGHTATVALLLKSGAGVNMKNRRQNTPLLNAAIRGHTETVALLLKSGANVNMKGEGQETPLHKAAYEGHTETVALLLKRGAGVNMKDEMNFQRLKIDIHSSSIVE